MISTGELKKGIAIELDGELWQLSDYHHIKMGRGSAQVRITLRNIKRGQTVERSFQAGRNARPAHDSAGGCPATPPIAPPPGTPPVISQPPGTVRPPY